ncbi:MAG: hypothetical protein QW756_07310 [Nitrososphaerota archaeon]
MVDETVERIFGYGVYVWSALGVDSGDIVAVYVSRRRPTPNARNI